MRLTLGAKLQAATWVALVLLAIVAGTGFLSTSSLASLVNSYGSAKLPSLQALSGLATAIGRATGSAAAIQNEALDAQAIKANLAHLATELRDVEERTKAFQAVGASPETAALWGKVEPVLESWRKDVQALVEQVAARTAAGDRFAEAAAIQSRVVDQFELQRRDSQTALDLLEELSSRVRSEGDALHAEASATVGKVEWSLGVVFLLGAAAVLVAGVLFARLVRRTLAALQEQSRTLHQAVEEGRLEVRGDFTAINWEFRPIVEGMNATMDAFVTPFRVAAESLDRISRGDVPPKMTQSYRGDFNRIKDSLNDCIGAVNALVADAAMLAAAGVEGRLATRADAARHQGDFRKVIQGVNDTLDAVIGPLGAAARCVDDISRGNIPPPITADYRGDFAAIKQNLNGCIAAVNALIRDTGALAQAGVEGRLSTRVDASKHQGDFRKVVEGVNATLDAVIGPLGVAAKCVDDISKGAIPARISAEYRGDFNAIRDNLNACIDAVNALVIDANALAQAAIEGKLSTRADPGRHRGDFRKIVEGVNRTLDAVIAPVSEAATVLDRLARRDLRVRMEGDYPGDHARMKASINATGEALHGAVAQVAEAVDQVSSASSQIASSSQAVASGASEQASSLEETSASLESVLSLTRQASDSAQQANTLSQGARSAATEGAAAVEQMQGAMGKIKASAESTSQIIKDINDIAFQTNLLALNAAVEAARAGEAGRGFAVVAEEVRSLALRAKEAATKTEELIRQSVKEAGEGEATSKHVAAKLGEIVSGIGKVSAIVSEIAAAAKEQTAGIEQVNKAIGEMDKVTQQNAASAEESSSATSELSGQAEELAAMVGTFQIERRLGAAPRRPKPLPASTPSPAKGTNGATAKIERLFPMRDEPSSEVEDF